MSLLRRAARRVASSPALARLLLGIEVPPAAPSRRYFDLTTPVLVRLVAPRVNASSRVLDMGTGAFAAIGLALWRRTGCRVVSSDVDAGLVEQARANVARNGAPIEVIRASFFDGVFARDTGDERGDPAFDCVTFNAPYVPTSEVGADGGDARYAVQSDGGREGTAVIRGFLAAFEGELRVRRAYLGVNTLMVPRRVTQACVAERAGLHLEETLSLPLLPVDVYVVGRSHSHPPIP